MSVTEQQAQSRAATDLHVLLVATGVTDERTVRTWSNEKLWDALWEHLVNMRLTRDVESLPFIALLRAGAIKRLVHLIIDFASLGRVRIWQPSSPESVLAETWWPAVRCLGQLSHTLFHHTRSESHYDAFVELRRHAHTLVDVFSRNSIFTLRNVPDENEFLCGSKLWCAFILGVTLVEQPENTDSSELNTHYPLTRITRVAAVALMLRASVAHWHTIRRLTRPTTAQLRVIMEAADVIARTLGTSERLDADIVKFSNVSFEEMILTFLVETDEVPSELPHLHHLTMFALCRLILAPIIPDARERELTEAMKKTRAITFSVKRLHRVLVAHRLQHGDGMEYDGRAGWVAEIVLMWSATLSRAIKCDEDVLVQEAIEGDLLFTLEIFVSNVRDDVLPLVEAMIDIFLIGSRTRRTSRQKFLDQLWAIVCRSNTILSSRESVVRMWSTKFTTCSVALKNLGHNDRARDPDELFCKIPGCKTLEPAATICGRCKTPYCSKECQEQDWKLHKASCSKSKK